MSECMTIADETIDQKDTEITPKTIVDFILEEVLLSAFVNSDKGCSRIGDFNIAEEFFQQDQLPHPKDFEQVDNSQNANLASNLNFADPENYSARKSLGLVIDSFVKEERVKPAGECTVITEDILANNELQIQNGQIHFGKNNTEKNDRSSYYSKDNVIANEKIEIEYFNEGKVNKIYVPLNPSEDTFPGSSAVDLKEQQSADREAQDPSEEARDEEDPERPFKPFTTEELRQVWGNGNSSLVGKWDGDALAQREEAVRLMEELSSVHVYPDCSLDPNRPRACAFAEEDVKKIIKEIEEISFSQCHTNSEDLDVAYHPEGQGDADLEVKTSSKSKDNIAKSQKSKLPKAESNDGCAPNQQEYPMTWALNGKSGNNKQDPTLAEERQLNSSFFNENTARVKSSLDLEAPSEKKSSSHTTFHSSSSTTFRHRSEYNANEIFPPGSVNLEEFQKQHNEEFSPHSISLSRNTGRLSGSKLDEFRLKNLEFTSELDVKTCQEPKSSSSDQQQNEIQQGGSSTNKAENAMTNNEVDPRPEDSQASSQTVISEESSSENGLSESPEGQKFKLHSGKMYQGTSYELAGRSPTDHIHSKSEEAFIDLTESVIQIINPSENNAEEDTTQITFSLLTESLNRKSAPSNVADESEVTIDKSLSSSDVENVTKRVCSGMTTIGPMKNLDYDPKDLTAPDIDYGKMTRITSSRQLAKDLALFSTETTTIRIFEEDDSDDFGSVNTEEDRAERTSLVNRDIASLTKFQKIREVMSYHPKPEEELEDDEVLARPRLDLKDVESMTDERYKVTDVSIPLLSFEIGETDLNAEKDLIDSMGLVISGLTNPTYFSEDAEDDAIGEMLDFPLENDGSAKSSDNKLIGGQSSKNVSKGGEITIVGLESENKPPEESSKISIDEQQDGGLKNQKYGTLGSVFKKASSKFLRKEGDLFTRNSKSLPRDASRASASDSIRSMLDDCQSSASNMLKKSRSLLKNTQGVFKSISQSRVSSDAGQKKPHTSESDMTSVERKFSGFLKKEDFTKAKNLIKEKVEKTFKNFEAGSSPEAETAPEKRDLRLVVRNRENLQVDRMENFKKLLPKTPLVYKSQFVKSQMNVQSNPQEAGGNVGLDEDQKIPQEALNPPLEEVSEKIHDEETEIGKQSDLEKEVTFQENIQWIDSKENMPPITTEELEPEQPPYIVMETVQGLPVTDLESPSSEKENQNTENKIETEGNDGKKTEASNSLPIYSDGGCDVPPYFQETDEDKTKPLERKIKTKKKKFTARFRSFWCSAFGRVKTPPGKGDLP